MNQSSIDLDYTIPFYYIIRQRNGPYPLPFCSSPSFPTPTTVSVLKQKTSVYEILINLLHYSDINTAIWK
jgi:hypothetical protein